MNEFIQPSRGSIVRGQVIEIDDTGEVQTVTVRTHAGVVRSGVEVASVHGMSSHAGADAWCLLLAVGDDQAHLVALPLMGTGTRFGNLPAGGAVLYDDAGNYLLFPADGSGTLAVAGLMRMVMQTLSIEAQAGGTFHGPMVFTDPVTFQAGVTFQADVTIQGALHVTGPVTGASFNGHT